MTRLRGACIDDDDDDVDVDDLMQAEPCCRTLLGNTGWLYLRSTFPDALSSEADPTLAIEEPLVPSLHGMTKGFSILPGSGKPLLVRRLSSLQLTIDYCVTLKCGQMTFFECVYVLAYLEDEFIIYLKMLVANERFEPICYSL